MAMRDGYDDQDPYGGLIYPQQPPFNAQPPYQDSTIPGQTPWAPGSQAPSSSPPGMHWDPTMANFVPDAAPFVDQGGSGGGGGAGGGLPSPFTSTFNAPSPINLGGPAGIPFIPQT